VRLLGRRLVIALFANDTLDGVREYEVGDLVAGYEGSGQGSAVDCDYEDFL
jgi:hypothetical protein